MKEGGDGKNEALKKKVEREPGYISFTTETEISTPPGLGRVQHCCSALEQAHQKPTPVPSAIGVSSAVLSALRIA